MTTGRHGPLEPENCRMAEASDPKIERRKAAVSAFKRELIRGRGNDEVRCEPVAALAVLLTAQTASAHAFLVQFVKRCFDLWRQAAASPCDQARTEVAHLHVRHN